MYRIKIRKPVLDKSRNMPAALYMLTPCALRLPHLMNIASP